MVDDAEIEARVQAAAEGTGVEFEIVPCDPALGDTAAFCEAYGYAIGPPALLTAAGAEVVEDLAKVVDA